MSHGPAMTALVTGATSGIGFFTAAGLAGAGYTVVVTGRDPDRGHRAVGDLRQRSGHDNVHFLAAEHATVRGNIELATRLADTVDRLDVLVNNVGGIYADRWETSDGYEGTLAMNFVGPFALTERLLPLLRAGGGRCVNVVSSAFTMVKGDPFDDPHLRAGYVGIRAYGRAKLLNVLWTQALAERERALTVYAVNPGMAWTRSTRQLTPKAVPAWRFVWPLVRWFQRRASAEKAAQVCVRVASGRDVHAPSGSYFAEKDTPSPLPDNARDPDTVRRGWDLGESLVARASTT
jgi:NAD(P)-dependent dehydrogenase (short-subunit alcohol dehydrogenase family)